MSGQVRERFLLHPLKMSMLASTHTFQFRALQGAPRPSRRG